MNSFLYRSHFFGAYNTNDTSVTLELQGTGEALLYWGDGEREHIVLPTSAAHVYNDNSLKTIRIYSWEEETITEVKIINANISNIEYDSNWINREVTLNLGGNDIDSNVIVENIIASNSSTSTRQINLFGNPISQVDSTFVEQLEQLESTNNLTFHLSPHGVNTYENA